MCQSIEAYVAGEILKERLKKSTILTGYIYHRGFVQDCLPVIGKVPGLHIRRHVSNYILRQKRTMRHCRHLYWEYPGIQVED